MAVAVEEVRQKLAEAKVSAAEAKREVQGPLEGARWWLLFGLLVLVILIAGRPTADDDPVVRRLAEAPEDDEGRDPAEDEAAARGKAEYLRGERGVAWEKLRDELGRS
jgi:hypothetical protein